MNLTFNNITSEQIRGISTSPGVYYFYNVFGKIIYIGKAKNIKKRVLSHFYNKSLENKSLKDTVSSIKFKETSSDLTAKLLETNEIKRYFPKFNSSQKHNKKRLYLFFYEDQIGRIHLSYSTIKNELNITFKSELKARLYIRMVCSLYKICERLSHLKEVNCSNTCACNSKHEIELHNFKMQSLKEDLLNNKISFILLNPLNNSKKKEVIWIKDNHYSGYGIIDDSDVLDYDKITSKIEPKRSYPESMQIVRSYILKKSPQILYENAC